MNQTCLPGPTYGGVVVEDTRFGVLVVGVVRLVVAVVLLVVVIVGVGVVGGLYLRVVVVSSSICDKSKWS